MTGLTYFRPWGFSINEDKFPNVHMHWRLGGEWQFMFYVALTRRMKWFCISQKAAR